MSRNRLAVLGATLFTATVLAGCGRSAGGGEGTVFAPINDFSQGAPATTIDIVDIGMPYDLHNTSGNTVTLRSISVASSSRAVHLTSVHVYSPDGPGVGLGLGDLLTSCRDVYKPYPLTKVTVAPHSVSNWHIVLAFTFSKPGRYDLRRVKVAYTANGQSGWQYLYLNTTIVIRTARKNAKPAFSGCP